MKTRFAPSPTGFLHIGSLRTALFAYLAAKQHPQGEFYLRIEDTDAERSKSQYCEQILAMMQWLNLEYHGEPVYQSERQPLYQAMIEQLVAEGKAYYCDRSQEDKEQHQKYDGHCRDLGLTFVPGKTVVRLKVPTEGSITFKDAVLGEITYQWSAYDDFIIARSDGSATYQLAVAYDDYAMGITHVIRGNDHINNTPKQLAIFQAMGATPPTYAHLPLILDDEGKRLSKRMRSADAMVYQDLGVLPIALINYLARLGWSHRNQEYFTMEELVKLFKLEKVHGHNAVFDETKLLSVNQHWMSHDHDAVKTMFLAQLKKHDGKLAEGFAIDPWLATLAPRHKTVSELLLANLFFFQEDFSYEDKVLPLLEKKAILKACHEDFKSLSQWRLDIIKQRLQQLCDDMACGFASIGKPLRAALTGSTQSPAIDITLYFLGQKTVLLRLERAIAYANT